MQEKMNFTQHFINLHDKVREFIGKHALELQTSNNGQKTLQAAKAMLEVAKIGQQLEGISGFGATLSLGKNALNMQKISKAAGLPFTFSAQDDCAALNAEFATILLQSALNVVTNKVQPQEGTLLVNYVSTIGEEAQSQLDHYQELFKKYNQPKSASDQKSSLPLSSSRSYAESEGEGCESSGHSVSASSVSDLSPELSEISGGPSPLSTPFSTPPSSPHPMARIHDRTLTDTERLRKVVENLRDELVTITAITEGQKAYDLKLSRHAGAKVNFMQNTLQEQLSLQQMQSAYDEVHSKFYSRNVIARFFINRYERYVEWRYGTKSTITKLAEHLASIAHKREALQTKQKGLEGIPSFIRQEEQELIQEKAALKNSADEMLARAIPIIESVRDIQLADDKSLPPSDSVKDVRAVKECYIKLNNELFIRALAAPDPVIRTPESPIRESTVANRELLSQVHSKVIGWGGLDSGSQQAINKCITDSLRGQEVSTVALPKVVDVIAKKVTDALFDREFLSGKGVFLKGYTSFVVNSYFKPNPANVLSTESLSAAIQASLVPESAVSHDSVSPVL
jgi:hypothetical protein